MWSTRAFWKNRPMNRKFDQRVSQKMQRHVTDVTSRTPVVYMTARLITFCGWTFLKVEICKFKENWLSGNVRLLLWSTDTLFCDMGSRPQSLKRWSILSDSLNTRTTPERPVKRLSERNIDILLWEFHFSLVQRNHVQQRKLCTCSNLAERKEEKSKLYVTFSLECCLCKK